MELLKLSKFKLQLQSLIGEVRDLREREQSVTDQIHLVNQKQKQNEEEYSRKVQELQAKLASSSETQEKLERKVSYLQNDYTLLEHKQNELKTTIQNLLQSRECFINAYQESFCEMKCSIEARDRKITILHEKITSHLGLFDSIEKEASAIQKVIHEVQGIVDQREDVVAGLKAKMDHVSAYEKVFIEKISALEEKIQSQETELQSKENIISELSAQMEAAKSKNENQIQVEEVKDLVIENMISEKETLHSEVRSLELILQRIQEAVTLMTEEDRRVFTSILTCEQGADERNKKTRYNDTVEKMEERLCETPTTRSQENSSVNIIPSVSPGCQHLNTDCSSIKDADHQLASSQYLQHDIGNIPWQSTNNPDAFDTKSVAGQVQRVDEPARVRVLNELDITIKDLQELKNR